VSPPRAIHVVRHARGVWFPVVFNTYHIKCLDTYIEC
jgi:hypothetical protein